MPNADGNYTLSQTATGGLTGPNSAAFIVGEAPHIFSDYQRTALPDGTYEATTPHRKV